MKTQRRHHLGMERLQFSLYWCGAILFGSSLINWHAVEAHIFKLHTLCKFCDVMPSICNGTGTCVSNCSITSVCESSKEVCVTAWHRDGENTTVETVCHDPALPFHGIMLNNYNNTQCVMKQYKALGPQFYMCSCNSDECNDELIFTPESQKREVEQSPIKFKDSTISKEDLDVVIANGIKLALQEQQNALDAIVASAVKEAMDSISVPALCDICTDLQKTNKVVNEFSGELERVATAAKCIQDGVDSVQAAARADRQSFINLKKQVYQLTTKLTHLEDRGCRNNIRIVGLPETAEGSDTVSYLKANLPKWIPSLVGRDIDIEQAHRVCDSRDANTNEPCTLIFRLLRWQDRSDIIKGARRVHPVKYGNNTTLLFFPDFSLTTTAKRKSFSREKGYSHRPGTVSPLPRFDEDHSGKKMTFNSPQAVDGFTSSLLRRLNPTTALSDNEATALLPGRNCKGKHHGGNQQLGEGNLVDMNE